MSQDEGYDGVGYRVTRVVYRSEFGSTHPSREQRKPQAIYEHQHGAGWFQKGDQGPTAVADEDRMKGHVTSVSL